MTNLEFMRSVPDEQFIKILEGLLGTSDNTIKQTMLYDWLNKEVDSKFFLNDLDKINYIEQWSKNKKYCNLSEDEKGVKDNNSDESFEDEYITVIKKFEPFLKDLFEIIIKEGKLDE